MPRIRRLRFCTLLMLLLVSSGYAAGVPDDCTQLIVGTAPNWNSMRGQMQLFERTPGGKWEAVAPAVPVLFGKHGLAWGSGLAGQNEAGLRNRARWRARPRFKMANLTYDAQLPPREFSLSQVTTADAWIDDVNHPDYNRFVRIPDPANPPPWFAKQKMRHNDFAYRWLVEIRHNSDPPVPGAGSAIFFHIRRGVNRPSAGCTTMAESNLVKLIGWLRPAAKPHYVLLPAAEYEKKWQSWDLPPPKSPQMSR